MSSPATPRRLELTMGPPEGWGTRSPLGADGKLSATGTTVLRSSQAGMMMMRTYASDRREPLKGQRAVHTQVRDEHQLDPRTRAEYEGEARKRWRATAAHSWGPAIDRGTHRNEDADFNGDASFTRWCSPSRRPERVTGKESGCRNAWKQQEWALEARQHWYSQNPKPSWYSSDAPLPRLLPAEIQAHECQPTAAHDALFLQCLDAARSEGRAHDNIHGHKLWG